MAPTKKNFDSAADTIDQLFSHTQHQEKRAETPSVSEALIKHEHIDDLVELVGSPEIIDPKSSRKGLYSFSIRLPRELKDELHEVSWKLRMTQNEYIVSLIRQGIAKNK